MKRAWLPLLLLALLLGGGALLWLFVSNQSAVDTDPTVEKVVINEAVRTLLYLPLYHAQHRGYFGDEGVQVEIVTGGTATNSFAAMLSGEADFSQADPMYVPISRGEGAETTVVAQVVGRIAVWGVAVDEQLTGMDRAQLIGRTIATHPRPMTAYTYTLKTIRDARLSPDSDVTVLQSTPGTEIIPLLNGEADFALTLEPNTSTAVSQGAHVVLSYPKILGDQVFTGLMTREAYVRANRETVTKVVRAYQRALVDLHSNPAGGLETALSYFPEVNADVLRMAVERMIGEEVVPTSVVIPEDSWRKAIAVRVEAGDLKSPVPRAEACSLDIMEDATHTSPGT